MQQQLGIAKQIDKNLSRPHGNHQGLSYGQLSLLLLTYIITQQDHRLCAVEPWVKTHREILELSANVVFFRQCESFLEYQRQLNSRKGRDNAQTLFGVNKIPTDNQIRNIGVNLAMVRLYARSPQVEKALWARPQARGQNISMIEALSWQGPIAPIQLCGSRSGLTFEAYIIRRVVPQLWPGACLVLDNSSIHQGAEIEAAVKAAGASLIYLGTLFS